MLTPEKAAIFKTAAQLTIAAMAARGTPLSGPLPIDPLNQEPGQRNINLQTWEVFRAFYLGLSAAADDETNFKSPTPASATRTPILPTAINAALQLPSVSSALSGNAALAPLVAAFAQMGANAIAHTATPVPAPGVTPAS
jgi:hypothetical protein